jgi:hypothetical protein
MLVIDFSKNLGYKDIFRNILNNKLKEILNTLLEVSSAKPFKASIVIIQTIDVDVTETHA